ncbi:MAG: hypothetical protein JO080_12480 [Mucilaginibacter sp.]|nr:hypothetical protein [Mucilaginibacter sp.]
MEEEDLKNELASIRSIMERSSKFISLSGLSGILAGVYALIGAAIAYYLLYVDLHTINPDTHYHIVGILNSILNVSVFLILGFVVLFASVSTGIILTTRKAKRKGQPIWGNLSRTLLFHMVVPLVTGGILIFIFLTRGYYGIIAPTTLIFYGLSLVGASNFTFSDVKYLGLLEIALGLIAACLPGYGLLFWAIGFGLLHIIYGSMMYLKYDK